MTPRQKEVLQILGAGRGAKRSRPCWTVSVRTVEFHKYKLMGSLGLPTVAELDRFAVKQGIVTR